MSINAMLGVPVNTASSIMGRTGLSAVLGQSLASAASPITALTHTAASSPVGGAGFSTSAISSIGADLIAIAVVCYAPGTGEAPTDNQGNTWLPLGSSNENNTLTQLFYCASPVTNASHTFTLPGSNRFATMSVACFSGTTVAPFDKQAGGTASVNTVVVTGSVTPAANNSLLIAAVGGGNGAYTQPSGFTITDQIAGVPSASIGGALAYLVQGTAAPVSATWTSALSGDLSARIAVFK